MAPRYIVLAGFHSRRLSPMRLKCDKIDFIKVCGLKELPRTSVEACKYGGTCEVFKIDFADAKAINQLATMLHYGLVSLINMGENKKKPGHGRPGLE